MENNINVMPNDYKNEAKRLTITDLLSDLASFICNSNINVEVFKIKNVFPEMYMFKSKNDVLIVHNSYHIWETDVNEFVAYLVYDGNVDNTWLTYNTLKKRLLDMK